MYCGKCGQELSDNNRFCPKCGTAVPNAVTDLSGTRLAQKTRPLSLPELQQNTKVKNKAPIWIVGGILVIVLALVAFGIMLNSNASGDKGTELTETVGSDMGNTVSNLSEPTVNFSKVQNILQSKGGNGQFSVYIKDLKTDKQYFTSNKNESFVAAGLVYIPIYLSVLEQANAGNINLDNTIQLNEDMLVGGTGKLSVSDVGNYFSIGELTKLMLDDSDNSAANILIDLLGGIQAVNQSLQGLGIVTTQLNRYLMDTYAISQGIENYTSAEGMANLLEKIVDMESKEMLLKLQSDGMEQYLPTNSKVYHQVGVLSNVYNDAGIVYGHSSRFILVVLSRGTTNEVSKTVIGEIANSVYEDLEL